MSSVKAVALLSGGLDSSLAIRLIQGQGIEILALHFLIPFSKYNKQTVYESAAKKISDHLRVKLRIEYLEEEFLKILKNPAHGYGKNLNPCIDCKILMLKKAKKIMQEAGASFIITGEVLGQRPMSQNKKALAIIDGESGLKGLLVRPLCAKLLPPTLPEQKGWIKREKLKSFSGRGRNSQIKLAEELDIKEYPWPAGGCLLTDPHFCKRLNELMEHKECSLSNIGLLKVGRHFRVTPKFKLVIGRNEAENNRLLGLLEDKDLYLEPTEVPGPSGLGRGIFNKKDILKSAQIVASYISLNDEVCIVAKTDSQKVERNMCVMGLDRRELKKFMVC